MIITHCNPIIVRPSPLILRDGAPEGEEAVMAEHEAIAVDRPPEVEHPVIFIDDKEYRAPERVMTGAQLRQLAAPPIGPDRDLWLEEHHGEDRLIGDNEPVELRPGVRFFSTPKHITPGAGHGERRP